MRFESIFDVRKNFILSLMIDTLDDDVHNEGSNDFLLNSSLTKTITTYSKWGKFISITSYILLGLLLLVGLYLIMSGISASTYSDHRNAYGTFLNRSSGGSIVLVGFIYVVISVVAIYPIFRFHQSCTSGARAIRSASVAEGIYALEKLTQAVKFYGILLIIYLAFVIVTFFIAMFAAMAATNY